MGHDIAAAAGPGLDARPLGDDSQIIANGQTIVYSLHQSIGHLGIFVSVGRRRSMTNSPTAWTDDLMPPGLCRGRHHRVDEDTAHPALVEGGYLFRLEARTLDDIRAIVASNPGDDRRFVTAARVSKSTPAITLSANGRALSTSESARALRKMHPNRLRFDMFSNENPMMRMFEALAEKTRQERRPVAPDNPLMVMERAMSSWISTSLNLFGGVRDAMVEKTFLDVYGSPLLQAMVGLGEGDPADATRATRDLAREAADARLSAELEADARSAGLPRRRCNRSSMYAWPRARAETNALAIEGRIAIRRRRDAANDGPAQAAAEGAVPDPPSRRGTCRRGDPAAAAPKQEQRRQVLNGLRRMIEVHGPMSEEAGRRLARIEKLFDLKSQASQKEGVDA